MLNYSEDDLIKRLKRVTFEEILHIYYTECFTFEGEEYIITIKGFAWTFYQTEIDIFERYGWTATDYILSGGKVL